MIIPDVNLLLYAVITGFRQHDPARIWLEQAINDGHPIGMAAPAIFGFLRIATNPRVLELPLAIEAAIGYVSSWLDRPNVEFLSPGPRHLQTAFALLTDLGTAGNLTTDVQLAAYAIERDATLCSNDTDFARFPDLRWMNPLQT